MDFFRAVPRDKLDVGKRHMRESGRRLPSNVPFFIDNLWELCRPVDKPSRRHSVYASPTPDLALENASAQHLASDQYVVCQIIFEQPPRFIQLNVPDARDHPDVRALHRLLREALGSEWSQAPLALKVALTPLFLPAVSGDELRQAANHDGMLDRILRNAEGTIRIWDTPSAPFAQGELFFEPDTTGYFLQPV